MDNVTLPPPLVGCLICHTEGTLTRSEGRRVLGLGTDHPVITCTRCGAVATLDWEEAQPETWRIRYRKIPRTTPYEYAVLRFGKSGWIEAEEALTASTDVYIQRERLQQVQRGKLKWLKPAQLTPPPPLMSGDEVVYFSFKPVTYAKTAPPGLFSFARESSVLDTGTFYLTDSKVHLLGQRRDRSHRLGEIARLHHDEQGWEIHVGNGDDLHHYRGQFQDGIFNGELVIAIVEALKRLAKD